MTFLFFLWRVLSLRIDVNNIIKTFILTIYVKFVCKVAPTTDVETLLGDLTSLTVEDKS